MKKAHKIAVIGGVGAASTIAMAIIDAQQKGCEEYDFCGFINDKDGLSEICGYPVLGGIDDIKKLTGDGYLIINTVYKVDGQVERVEMFEDFNLNDESLGIFRHPDSYVAPDVHLSPGCVIMPGANISSGVKFGKCVRVMSGGLIGHDCVIDDHAFFAANSCVGSHVQIYKAAYCGLNCTIGGKLTIGRYSVIGMGSVVTKNVDDFQVVAGNPAKYLRDVKDKIYDI